MHRLRSYGTPPPVGRWVVSVRTLMGHRQARPGWAVRKWIWVRPWRSQGPGGGRAGRPARGSRRLSRGRGAAGQARHRTTWTCVRSADGVSSAHSCGCPGGSTATRRTGCRRYSPSAGVISTRVPTRSSSTPRPRTSWPGAAVSRSVGSPRTSTIGSTSFKTTGGGCLASSNARASARWPPLYWRQQSGGCESGGAIEWSVRSTSQPTTSPGCSSTDMSSGRRFSKTGITLTTGSCSRPRA